MYIWRLDRATQTWTRTNTVIDDRANTRADVLWDGTKLYAATHTFHEDDGSGTSRLLRFSYNTSTDTYSRDSGFPVTINSVRSETLVIAKDSTGQLWATWEQGGAIWLNRTTTSDTAWGTPFVLPGSQSVNSDDISSIIAFGGSKVGVLWSDQSASPDTDFFAVHDDAAGDTTWTIETAYSGTNVADDHVNLKTDSSGRVYAVVKTSLAGSNPLIVLLARGPGGGWTNHRVSVGSLDETRGILELDEVNGLLRVFVTSAVNGGTINQRTSPIGTISFASGEGTEVLKDASALMMNNATSTKQNVTADSGLIVVGYNDTTRRYWHADVVPGAGGDVTAPQRGATSVDGATLSIAYDEPLATGSVPDPGAYAATVGGSPRAVTNVAVAGSGVTLTLASPVVSTDSVRLSYTAGANPIQDVAGNLAADFTDAVVTNATPPTGGGGTLTFTPTDDAQVRSTSAATNYGSITTVRLREDAAGDTYRTYLKFTVSGLTGPVTAVKLRLYATDASPNIVRVFPVAASPAWAEGTVNWNNKPALGTPELGSAAVPTLNAYNEITLSPSAVSGNGAVSFGLTISSTNSAIFSSSEGANAPQLVVTSNGGPPPNTPPSANATSATTPQDTAVPVALSGADAGTCDLAFSIVSGPSHGSLGSIGGAACTSGSPNTDNASVTYTPTAGYSGSDSFTYRVSDGDLDSATATATLSVTPVGGGDITAPQRGATSVDGATLSIAYDEPLATGSVPDPGAYAATVGGSPRAVTNVAVAGSGVTLTLASPVVSTDSVRLSYTAGANPIQDVAGNLAADFTDAVVTNATPPTGGGGTLTFTPTDDAQVRSTSAATNYGSITTVRLREDAAGDTYRTYLKFTVSGLTGPVTAVKLRLYATDASPNIVRVFPVAASPAWAEGTVNWNNKPALGTPELGSAAVPTLNAYNEITLSPSAVSGNGAVSFGLTISSTNSAIFSSSEGANAPQLVVTYS